jgi:dTDP-4-amino-4,6-dideoxygalactose transaminase
MALKICLKYLNLDKEDLVLVPSFTFCATAQAVEHAGAQVLFGDIDRKTLCLDPESFIVKNSQKMIKAVVPVHLGGNKAYTDYKVPVVEDSAHRIARNQCLDNPNPVCFSFYPTKNMTTGEGGMIATNDEGLYHFARKARSHGRTKLIGYGYQVEFSGYKGNLPDILSAIGLAQLRKLDKMTKKRNQIVQWYNEKLKVDWQGIPIIDNYWEGNHLYPYFTSDRSRFINYMKENGVECSAHFEPLHKMIGFVKHNKFKLPITEDLGGKEVSLPLHPRLRKKDIKRICNLIKKYEQQQRSIYHR